MIHHAYRKTRSTYQLAMKVIRTPPTEIDTFGILVAANSSVRGWSVAEACRKEWFAYSCPCAISVLRPRVALAGSQPTQIWQPWGTQQMLPRRTAIERRIVWTKQVANIFLSISSCLMALPQLTAKRVLEYTHGGSGDARMSMMRGRPFAAWCLDMSCCVIELTKSMQLTTTVSSARHF